GRTCIFSHGHGRRKANDHSRRPARCASSSENESRQSIHLVASSCPRLGSRRVVADLSRKGAREHMPCKPRRAPHGLRRPFLAYPLAWAAPFVRARRHRVCLPLARWTRSADWPLRSSMSTTPTSWSVTPVGSTSTGAARTSPLLALVRVGSTGGEPLLHPGFL